jgi:hypothetical protein
MSSPQHQAAEAVIKDALRIAMKYKLTASDIRQKILDKVRRIGEGFHVTGEILLVCHSNRLEATLSVRHPGGTVPLKVQKNGDTTGMSAAEPEAKKTFDTRTACDLVRSLKPGDRVNIVFVNKTFDGDIKGLLYMLFTGFSRTIDWGGDGMGMMTLKAVADSGRWEGFRTYTVTILEGFDAQHFIDRTISRYLIESIDKVEQPADAIT